MSDDPPADHAPAEVWHLTFRPMPSPVPPAHRVRSLLKHALRVLGLRCVEVRGEVDDQQQGERPG